MDHYYVEVDLDVKYTMSKNIHLKDKPKRNKTVCNRNNLNGPVVLSAEYDYCKYTTQ